MLKKRLKLILFLLLLNQSIIKPTNLPGPIDWLASSGLVWLLAQTYIVQFYPNFLNNLVGSVYYDKQESEYIRSILSKYIDYDWSQVEIKVLKKELRRAPSTISAGPNVLYVNPDFYNRASDFRSDYERRLIIVKAGLNISLYTHKITAGFLTLFPILSHLGLNKLANYINKNNNKNKIYSICSTISDSYIFNNLVNIAILKSYFKLQKKYFDKEFNRLQKLIKKDLGLD